MRKLTQELVRKLLDYDAETGVLTWKARERVEFSTERAWKTWTARYSGKPAARLGVRGRQVYLGSFRSREEARQAYEEGLRKNFGEFVPNG